MIGAPSIFKFSHRSAAFARVMPTFALSCDRKTAAELLKLQKSGQCLGSRLPGSLALLGNTGKT